MVNSFMPSCPHMTHAQRQLTDAFQRYAALIDRTHVPAEQLDIVDRASRRPQH